MKLKLLFSILFISSFELFSQQSMIVYFKDKQGTSPVEFSSLAMERREKNNVQLDEFDYQLNPTYCSALAENGTIINSSRWLNAVTYSTYLTENELMEQFSFIQKIKIISSAKNSIPKKDLEIQTDKSLSYGFAYDQIHQIGLICLHDLGFTGEGVFLGVIDGGFQNVPIIPYFDSVFVNNRILDTHDFINNTGVYDYAEHGTMVTSCIVGNKPLPNEYIGTAKDVNLALYVAEDVFSESEIEEFNVVSALERCDSVGVELVNISLGYFDFDDSTTNHTYNQLDGITTIAAMGVNVAFSKGIVVSVSAGNSGPATISTPCDAIGCLCVGAVDQWNNYASFSSAGPSADGRVKPDVATMGQDAWIIDNSGTLVQGSGTSFSSPILAGAIACLMQAHPNNTANEIMNAIRMSASQFNSPDIFLGYGIPDFCTAHDYLTNLGVDFLIDNESIMFPNPANKSISIQSSIQGSFICEIIDVNGKSVLTKECNNENNEKVFQLSLNALQAGNYILRIHQVSSGISISKNLIIVH